MPNTFDAVPDSRHLRSSAFLPMEEPLDRLEEFIEEAQLHRGSLREEDGYTIPFREGGQVRIRVQGAPGPADEDGGRHSDEAEQTGPDGEPGLVFHVDAPTEDRRDYIEGTISETARTQLGAEGDLDWQRD